MELFCATCDKFEEVSLKKIKNKFKVKDIEVEAEVTITVCNVCGEEVYNEEAEKQNDIVVFDAFKKQKRLLTSIDIKRIREKYELSQSEFSKLLGFGEKTITRYENGSIQDAAHDNLMRLVQDGYNYRILTKGKEHLSSSNQHLDNEIEFLAELKKLEAKYRVRELREESDDVYRNKMK